MLKMINQIKRLFTISIMIFSLGHLGGCFKEIEYTGNYLTEEMISGVKLGDSVQDVIAKLGSPTYKSTFEQHKFVYIQKRFIIRPILDPKVEEYELLEITFNDHLQVADINYQKYEDIMQIKQYKRRIEIEGNKLNPVQQILGNIGKYNSREKAI